MKTDSLRVAIITIRQQLMIRFGQTGREGGGRVRTEGRETGVRMGAEEEAVDYEKSGLFFIKSKHVFREFRNHQYFQGQRNGREGHCRRSASQFVESPAPFGVNNAYFYMRDQMSKNYLKRQQGNQFKTINHRYLPASRRELPRERKKSVNLTLPNLAEINGSAMLFKAFRTDKLPSPLGSELKETNLPCEEHRERQRQSLPLLRQHFVHILYMNKFHALDREGGLQLRVNIFSYILKTFLKTKVNYLQLNNDQFLLILRKILQIYPTPQQTISLKDVINCKSVQQIFLVLEQYGQDSSDFKEIVRHFFIANAEVYRYQFDCIRDEMKYLINLQTNCINHDEKLFVFNMRTGRLLESLLELLEGGGRFVVGAGENAFELYQMYTRQRNSKREAAERIKKWKSIVPNQTPTSTEFHSLSSQKYQTIFTNAQRKRHVPRARRPLPSRNGSFIDRSKLVRVESIFQ